MKAQSFEYQLRHTIPPAPDPQARLRARGAAVAEFERLHGPKGEPGPLARARRPGIPGLLRAFHRGDGPAPAGRVSRSTLWGGIATACVVVIGVSVVWLMPPEQRVINLRVPVASKTQPALADAQSDSGQPEQPSASAPKNGEQAQASAQAETGQSAQASTGAQRVDGPPARTTPSGQRAERRSVEPSSGERAEKKPVQTPAGAQPAGTGAPGTPGARPQAEPQPHTPITNVASSSARAPAPPAPQTIVPGSAGQTGETSRLEEVIVSGAELQHSRSSSPSGSAATPSEDELQETTVTGSRIAPPRNTVPSRKRVSAPAPVTAPATGGDRFAHFETNAVKRVADEPVSTFSVDVDTASYSFVRRQLTSDVMPQADAVRVEEMINYFDYAWPVPESRDPPFRPTVTVSDSPWGEGKKLIHIGIRSYTLPIRQQPDVNLVLLLDVSGSMDEPDKLPLAQRSMALLLDSLKPTDTVAIVVYAGAAGAVLRPTPVENKEVILRALEMLRAGGSTAGAEGIRLAYELAGQGFRKDGVNRILLATDGDFNVGITDRNELESFVRREREKGVYLSVLGFGQGNYRDEIAQTLAQNGNGVAAYIDTLSEARKVLVQEATASLFTIAKDVKLQVEFNPATVAEYRLVGYETRALNRQDFNNDKVDAGDVGSGHTVTAIYEITPVGSEAALFGERRYAERGRPSADRRGKANEYGFLKIRYKLPNGSRSRLLQQPIRVDTGVPAALRQEVEFSTAVAGFGQLLRGGTYTGSLGFEDVLRQAQGAVGEDPHGYRAQFLELVRRAQHAKGM